MLLVVSSLYHNTLTPTNLVLLYAIHKHNYYANINNNIQAKRPFTFEMVVLNSSLRTTWWKTQDS